MMLVYVYIYIILCYASSIQCIVCSIDSIDSDPNKDKPVTSYSNSDALTNSFFGGILHMRIYIYYYYIHHNYTHITTILFSQTVSDLVLSRLRSRARWWPKSHTERFMVEFLSDNGEQWWCNASFFFQMAKWIIE